MPLARRNRASTGPGATASLGRPEQKVGAAADQIAHGDGRVAVDGQPSAPQVAGVGVEAGAGGEHRLALDRRTEFGGATLLVSDVRVAFMLLNEARYRSLERLFGIPREQANVATVIAILIAAKAVHDRTERMVKGPGGPTRADALLGAAVLKESIYRVAGPSSRERPLSGTAVAIAALAGMSGPALSRSIRGIRTDRRRIQLTFKRYYGRPIGPIRRRPGERGPREMASGRS